MVSNLQNCKQLSQALGACRDLTSKFNNYKNGSMDSDETEPAVIVDPKSRFLVRNTGFTSMKSPEESLVNDRGTLLPTSTKASSDDSKEDSGSLNGSIQLSARHLPPVYVDIQEEIEQNLEEINKQMKNLQKLHMQRIKDSFFSDGETIQLKTIELTHQITGLIKESDMKLKELSRAETNENSSEQIRKNMQTILATRLKNVTFELRKMEKDHYMKVQELHGDANPEETSIDDSQVLEQEEDMDQIRSQHRSKEINQLTNNINSLAVLFKDFSVLVIEQGTILDRIDFNIENAKDQTKKATVHLEKALVVEKSTRARSCIVCLAITILVMVVLLVIKH